MSKDKLPKFDFKSSTDGIEVIDFKNVLSTRNPVIFDTNFLFVTFEFKIDIISELRRVIGSDFNLFIYEGTIDELVAVEKKGDKNKKFLPLISKMLRIYEFKIIKSKESYVDEQIIDKLHDDVVIATNDALLRKVIWENRKRVVYLRQKKYLEIK